MTHVTCQPVWKIVVVLIMLQVIKGNAWFVSRKRSRPPRKPSAAPPALNCGPSAWSAWSECSPFCDNNPTRYRTRTVKENNKCITKRDEEENFCPPRGGCRQLCDNAKKKCSCQPGFITLGANCVDKNECKSNGGKGPCDQKCENYPGSYFCNCNTGYRLEGKHSCTPLDCDTPQFSNCPQEEPSGENEAHLALCAEITSACQNGTKYDSQCSLTCPKHYKLALKNPSKKWSDYSGFEFRTVSSRIICHESPQRAAIWHSKLDQYYCRRNNDPPLSIKLADTSVKEGLPPGTIVGRLSTNDAQRGQEMVYSIQNKQEKSLFRCNGSVLETSLVLKWFPNHINKYPVRIRAQDNGSPPMWLDQEFNIRVENVNDPPRSIEISRNWVYENATRGTLVGRLSAIDDDVSAQRNSAFVWKLLQDNSGKFRIEGSKVLVENPLSYDTIKLCYIKVSCSDSISSTEKEIPIYIINLIDPPTLSITGTTVAENSPHGTVIAQIVSKSESNEVLEFMISASNPNATSKFGLSPNTVCKRHENAIKYNISCYVNITVSGQLDYEKIREFTLQVYVRNNASSNFRKWNVSVENVNEKPDKLETNGMRWIPEDMESGNDICFFTVSDPDNRNEMTQNHSCHLSTKDEEYFHINGAKNSLQIKKNKSLNYEEHQSHIITVTCVDNGSPALSITRQFFFSVTDVDEPIQSLTLSNNKVRENSVIGTEVGILHAYDPDIHQPQTMIFSLVEPQHSPFGLKGMMNNGALVVNGSLNFEETSDYMLTIRVTDTVGRYLQMPFIVKILDVREAPTNIKLSSQEIKENLPPGSFISNITMIDEDENTLTYCTLLQDGGGKITLADTTLLTGGQVADYEEDTSHLIRISLQCCDQNRQCLKKDFSITIQDVNEPPTDITIDNLRVRENEKDIMIGNITILDPDEDSGYHCSLTNSNHTEYLKIVKKTLYLIKELNFEAQQMMAFEVTCREKENSSMYFTKQFDLKIVDVNEAPNAGCKEPLFVSYEESFGTVLGSLNVSDPDNMHLKDACKPKQKLIYNITEQENLPFTIADGYLVKRDQVEKNRTYIIEVSVQDDGVIASGKVTRKRTTRFNCTVISRALIGLHITLSSNRISEGSLNASVIGYLGSRENMEYGLIQDKCDDYPFAVEDNKLMLMLPTDTTLKADEKYTVPKYVMVHVNARNKLYGQSMDTRFVIFIKDDIPRRLCFSNDPIKLSHLANSKLGPIIIFQDNDTTLACPLERKPQTYFKCNIKANCNESSRGFSKVDFTNAFRVDDEMYLRVNISEEVSNVEKLALDLFCWDPKRLFVFVKGKIRIRIAPNGVCENDRQARDESLCENSECSEDSLCTKVVNVTQRCVPNDDQLFIIIPATIYGGEFCKFESCLQEILGDKKSNCLLTWNEKRREKRASENNLYLDTLEVKFLSKSNRFLLRAALWKLDDNKQLTILSKEFFPNLQDQNDVIFITSEEECDWLKGYDIKCPVLNSSTAGKSSGTSLGTSRIQVAVGIGSAILLVVIIIILVYCIKKRQKREDKVKRSPVPGDFDNIAYDDSELKELPPIPKEEETRNDSIDQQIREKHGKPKYDFKNPVYEDPSQLESIVVVDNHIYNETNSQNATYAEPELLLEKSTEISKEGKVISNPVYATNDIIPVEHPIAEKGCTTEREEHHASKDPHYEKFPLPDENQINAWKLQNEINKTQQDLNTTNPHYEELPLPDIEELKLMTSQAANANLNQDTKENMSRKEPEYQELPEVKNEKKPNAISRFSKLLSDFIAPKQQDSKLEHTNNSQSHSDPTNSSISETNSSEKTSNESMINPREKAQKANPANKYPFYEELPPVQENNKRLSEQSNQSDGQNGGRHSSHLYHVLEGDNMNNENKNELQNESEVGGPHYYVLEKCSSTGKECTEYQSLHRELEQPSPTYESYRLPQNSGSDLGK